MGRNLSGVLCLLKPEWFWLTKPWCRKAEAQEVLRFLRRRLAARWITLRATRLPRAAHRIMLSMGMKKETHRREQTCCCSVRATPETESDKQNKHQRGIRDRQTTSCGRAAAEALTHLRDVLRRLFLAFVDFAQRLIPRESILTTYILPSLPLARLPTKDSAALVMGPGLRDLLISREVVCLLCNIGCIQNTMKERRPNRQEIVENVVSRTEPEQATQGEGEVSEAAGLLHCVTARDILTQQE